jgi:hypothetical protein
VHGAYAVVLGGGEDERLGVVAVGLELVVGRDVGEELALLGNGDGAVLADLGGSGGDVFETEHVEEGDLGDNRVPHISGCWVNSTPMRRPPWSRRRCPCGAVR